MDLLTNKNILVVGAHSDDEVLGVGGAILKAKQLGSRVEVLIVTDSVSTQYQDDSVKESRRLSHLDECCQVLGVDHVEQWDFPDMRLDTVTHVELNRKLDKFLAARDIDTIFVHHPHDINLDHRLLFDSVMVAARPIPGQSVQTVMSYYTPSSSEWGAFDNRSIFSPNVFVDIRDVLDTKLAALAKYEDEVRPFPHPRSFENIRNMAAYFGSQVGLFAAEAFQLMRAIQR